MPKQSSRQQEIGDLFKSSYNTTSTGASTSTENNRSTTQESNASSARQQEIAGLWSNRQVYTQPTTNAAKPNTPTTPKTTQATIAAQKAGNIMALGAGVPKTTKTDLALNAAIGYGAASFMKLLSDFARPTGELTMGENVQATLKGIPLQEAQKQKREKSKANEWSQRLNESAVDWYESAQENEAKAREGLGDFGNLLVSTGIAGTQMAGDLALNALVPGSGIFAMAGRAYGSGSLEAQANGLTAGQQQLAGLKSAAIETITEKLFGYGSKVAYGSGLVKSPQVIESAINTLAKTNAGRTALKVLVGANEEGLEEVLSDLLNPIADRLLGLDSGTGNVYEDLQAQQVLEDYLVGGILGLIGGGTQVISGETMRANEEQRASEQAQQDIVSKGLESAEGTHSRILAEEYNKILAESSKRGHRYLYDSEVNSLQTALDMESRQGSTPNADAFNTAQQAQAQQDTAMRMMGARVFSSNDISSNIAKAVAGNAKSSASAQTTRSFTEVTSAISNSTQTTEQAQKLNATAKAVINGNEVSNSQLDALAENNSAMQAIAKYAGVELPTFKGTASEVRTAKRNWLKGISTATAQRIKQAQAQQAGKTAQRQTMPVVDYARKYGEDADKVVQAFSDGERIESNLFNAEFDAAYQLGKSGVDVDKAMAQKSIQDLSPSQRMVAYQMGVKAKSNTDKRKAKVKSKGNVSFDGETYTERGKTKTLPAVNPNGLTQEQKASIEVIKKIAEVTGINFVFYESEANEQGRYTESNGMFKDNTIYLDINAAKQFITDKSAILRTASHELTHYIQKHSPAQYAELKAFISQTLVENESLLGKGKTFDTLVANKAYTRGLSVEEATDEVIADACEMMLRDSKAVQTLAEENPTLFKTIRNWLREFCRKLRKAFEGVETAYTESTALLNELGRYTDELQRMWDNAFIDAVRSDFTEMENDAGDTVVLADNNGHAQLSVRTYDEGGREQLENYLAKRVKEGAITTAERDDMLSQMEAMYKICKDYAKQYTLFGQWSEAEVRTDPITGEPIFSVVKANGDYALNLDFSLVCKKRRTLDAVFNEMISQGIMDDFDMVERSIAAINDVIRENDFETACSLCFVDTKRYRQAMVADSFVRIYNGLVRSMVKDGQKLSYFNFGEDKTIINPKDGIHTLADSELDFTKIEQFLHNPKYMPKAKKDGGMTTGSVEYRVAKLLKESPQDRKLLKRGDFMSTIGFDNVRQHNTRVLGLYNAKKGAGGPKAAQSDVQYLSEILAQKKFNADAAYNVGGVRVQSFSDYIPRLCFDYVQMMGDLSAKQLPAHAYTKEPLFALQFGRTGMKINMSLVPEVIDGGVAPGLDKDGNYAWRDGQSFGSTVYGGSEEFVRKCYDIIGKEYNGQDRLTAQEGYELAMAIQSADGYHNNCGTIAVGVSNAHILKLIRDPNIRMVIPYHKSSLNHLVAVMTNVDKYVNYTEKQNTRLASGKKLERGDFNFNEALRRLGDAKAAADEYLAWCDEHNYIPKFEEFRNEENYYKLLEDFTCYDRDGNAAPQGAVQVNFPTADDAFGSMSDLIEMGLIEDTNLNAKQTAKVPEIVKQIKATLPELEQKWKDEANAKKKPKKVQKSDRDNFSSAEGESLQYSVREEAPPEKTKIGYKVFKVRNGQLYPTKVKNPSGQGTPLGVWLNADTGELARDADGNIKTNTLGRISVKADGGTLAWRPGWHLGELPEANQMNKSNPNVEGKPSEVGLMHEDYVFCECEFAADINYQMEAFQMGFNKNGNYQHKLAGLPYLPKNGYYRYRTNPDPNTSPWFISGAIKITRILDDAERKAIIDKYNAEHPDDPMYYAPRKGGDLSGKAFEKRFGFRAGSVTASDVSGMAKGVDYSDEIRNLAGYAPQKINWDNKAFKEAFAINKTEKSYEDYRKEYEGKAQFSNRDSEYLELAKDPEANREQLQAMVDEAAKKAGYTEQVFHGTGNQFNVFKRNINGIYTTDTEAVAGTYGSRVLRLYGKKGNRVLRIDAHNAPHFSIGKEYIPLDFSDYPLLRGKDNYRTDDITKIANREGYDVVVISNVYDTSSAVANIEGDGFATDIVYFDPNNLKSADPVTYDDNGNVIPLSERFNAGNEDIRYSTRDAEYLSLAKDPEANRDKLQAMVDEAAKKAGYEVKAYHGTHSFGRTKFNREGWSTYLTSKPSTAKSFSGGIGVRGINQKLDDSMSEKELIEYASNSTYMENLKLATQAQIDRAYGRFNDYGKAKIDKARENGENIYHWEDENLNSGIATLSEIRELVVEKVSRSANGGVYAMYAKLGNALTVNGNGNWYYEIPISGDMAKGLGNSKASTDQILRYADENGYDSVVYKDIREGGDYGNAGISTVYAVVKPDVNLKSADPVTYDDNGNVIPLSERFNAGNEDIRYSTRDAEYLSLAKDPEGNRDKLQAMVDEAAKKAGYNSPMLYHGTNAFGFTKLKTEGVEANVQWSPFFTANREDISATYVKYGKVRGVSSELDEEARDDAIEEYKESISDSIWEFRRLIDRHISEWVFGQTDNSYLESLVENANPEAGYGDGVYDVLSEVVYDAFYDNSDLFTNYIDADDWAENSKEGNEIFEKIVEIEGKVAALHELETGGELGGIYQLYAKLDNLYVIDAQGKAWNELESKDLPVRKNIYDRFAPYKTRDVALWARDNGYDGVHFKNIRDNGAYGRTPAGDVYTFFKPQSQVKSADPVTYDDNGNIIPLSERFEADNDDIRYSTRDSEGNELSPQQQEFFKDSKVRDEDGNLLVVYHGTDAEFTVFDRTKGRTNMDIQGMFFSPWELDAGGYGGNVGAYYINITNPASESMGYKALQKFKGQNGAGIKAREYLESLGYDGVNNGNEEYIAFNANQIKLTTNLNPTESEDIRYSERVTPADIAGFDKEAQEIIKNANRRVMYASHPTTMTANRFEKAFADMNGKGYFAFIDPWDFLYLTTNSVEDFLERNPNRLNEGVSEDWGTVNNIQNADALFLRVEDDGNGNWKVIGHEGRHRMAALYRDGVDRVAVAIRMVGAEKIPQKLKRTSAQFGIGHIYIHDAIPATTEYKEVARKIFASEQGDIRYSFRGENSALKNDNLDVAEQMVTEGYNSEKIRLATGWFKGYDGKWRYEIDDSGAKLDDTLPKAKAEEKYEKSKAKLDSDYKAGKIGESLYHLKVTRIGEEYRESINSFKLKDILKHPKLFKAYPQIKEIPISYASLGEGILGQTDGKSMKISRSVSQDEKLSVILHECQHIIQRIEGFARGSNIVEAAIDADDEIRKARAALAPKRTAVYDKAWDTINAYIKKQFPKQYEGKKLYGANYEGLPRLIERYWYASTEINVKGELDDSGRADEVLAEAKKYKRFDAGIFTEIGKLANEYNAIQTQFANVGKEYESPFDRYQRTAGEIEARDVQARIKLTKAERKATRPDIDRDNAIVKYHEDDAQHSERDSDRELLSTALESVARTKTEKALIAQYKENLSTLEDRQRTLQQARKELSDARKAKDTARAKSLENTVETLAKSVNAADEKLLKLQATEPLRNVVKRARTEERRAAKVKRDEAVKKTKAQAAAQKKKELDRVREQRDKRIEQVKKHNDEVNRNKRERSNVTAEWHSIAKLGVRFQQLIDHPTQKDSGHAPVGICQSALKLCKCFEIADRKRVIGNVKGAINELKARYASIKDDSALGIFHEQEMYNVIDAVSNEINALDSTEALNAETLHKIVKMLKMLDRTMVNANKFISHSIDKTIAQAGREWAKEINDATPMLKGKIGQFLNWQLRPDTFFKRLSGFAKNSMGEQIQAMFTEGTEKKLKVQQDFYLHFKDLTERKEYLELGKYKGEDLVDVGLVDADGNSILVTRDMMLAIYKHLSSNDNFMAVAYGGFAVPDLADYYRGKSKSAYDKSVLSDCMDAHMWEVQTEIMRIKAMISATEDEMQKQALKESLAELEIEADLLEREAFNKVQEIYINIQEKLTEYERELLNASTRWMDKSADYINEETMRMYGIEKAKVDNYWPIHRDTNFINTDLRTAVNDINLENWGSLKERVQSHAPVLLTGFAFELDNHTRRMSDFVGYAAVQRDFSKLYNTKLPAMRSSLARIVQQKFGSDNWLFGQSGQSYIDEYISAVSGSVQNGDALSNLYGNLAQATLSLNLRVAVSQLASIPTAAAEVGWGNVARGLGEGFKIAFSKTAKEELVAKDPWYFQRYRGEGGMVEIASMKDASNFIGRQWNKLARSKVGSKLVNWCQDFDAFATSMMWAMAEEQVKENGGKPGDSNYDRLVSNVYRDIIRKTQPNYTVTERSGLLRDKRGGMKFLTMYKTQSNQNLNILYEASATLRKYKQDFANGKNGVTKADIKKAQKAVAQGYTAVLIGGTLAFSILRFLANAIMHSLDNYRDDEDDLTLMSILGGITKETVSATAGMVAFGGQVYDFVLPLIEDGRYYGLSDSAFAALSNVLEDGYRLITKDDRDFEDFYKVFKDISNVLGLPTNNVRKLVNGARYHIEDLINGEFLSYEAGVERSQAVMAGKILDAVRAGDTDTADELFADAVESSSAQEPEKAVKAKVKSALKDAYNAGEIDDAEAQKILQDYFGYDKNAAYFEMRKFSEDVSSTYSPLYDALETGNRSDIRKEINDLLAHGKEEKDIKQSVTGHYREAYRNGSNEERVAIRKAMYASGLWDSSDEIIALCNKWLESK